MRWKARVLAALVGVTFALSCFVVLAEKRVARRSTVSFEEKSDSLTSLLTNRTKTLAAGPEIVEHAPWRMWLDERTATQLFPIKVGGQSYDPYSYYKADPGADYKQTWPEHPNRQWFMRNNQLSLREDEEVSDATPDLRILVTGDSHTDGVCDNAESFANRLEGLLDEAHPGKRIEVLNGGRGGYDFYNYAGTLERLRDLKPDVFLVAVYGGNDFEELLTQFHYFGGTRRPQGTQKYWPAVQKAVKLNSACMSQGFLSIKYFAENPEQIDIAVTGALGICGDICGRARARGTLPVFVYLPSMYELDPEATRLALGNVMDVLELDEQDLIAASAMADRFIRGLEALDVEVIDLRPAFRSHGGQLYWRLDHHINVAAHELAARTIFPRIQALLGERP